MDFVVIEGRCETEMCVFPNVSVSDHILADQLQLLVFVYLNVCVFFVASLSEIGNSQSGLSYWLLCALALLWSGESTEMKTGTVRGHMRTKYTNLILSVSVPHSYTTGLQNSI